MTHSVKRVVRNSGFCCALVATVLLLCLATRTTAVIGPFVFPAAPVVLLLTMFLLMLAANLNDYLISAAGLVTLKVATLAGGMGSLLLLVSEAGLVGAALTALFIASSVLLWGSSLAYYERTELLLATAVSFCVAGLVLMAFLSLEVVAALLVAVVAALLSTLAASVVLLNPVLQHRRIELEVSRLHGISGRGNNYTIAAIGMTVGAALVMGFALPLEPVLLALIVGGTVALASLATVFFRARFKQAYEDLARRSIAVCTTCSLLPYPFVPVECQLVCVCIIVVTATVNCIILIDAIAETARLKRVSPFWLIGNEGAFFVCGTLVTLVLFWFTLLDTTVHTTILSCVILAVAFAALQIIIEGQSYPYFEMLPEEDTEEYLRQNEQRQETLAASGGALWRERLEAVATCYKLSPRQQEVMRLLLKGRDVKFIMSKFVISQATAKTHVYNLYKKLGVHSRRELLDLIEQTQVEDS